MPNLTDVLTNIAGDIQLGALIEGNVVPIIIGTVKEVKALVQGETIEYTVAITTGTDNATQAVQEFTDSLNLINSELVKNGKAPLPIPGQ